MGQPFGDPFTTFQVHGSGFVPSTRVALSVLGPHSGGTIPPEYDPYVDPKGTFNYTIDQQHIFFPGGVIPVGVYHVTAKDAASGQQATQKFTVDPVPPGSPPPPRPAGSPPPGNVRRRRAWAPRPAPRPAPRTVPRTAPWPSKAPASTTGPPAVSTRPDRSAGRGRPA